MEQLADINPFQSSAAIQKSDVATTLPLVHALEHSSAIGVGM